MKPLMIELFAGLHGWGEGAIAEGYRVIGYDIVDMCEMLGHARPEGIELILQDVTTLHGSQFKDAALIVASPPCQRYSYMAMPWALGKAKAAAIEADTTGEALRELNLLFDTSFRLQREASEAAGHHIPMVVENVRGAVKWVGPSKWNYGSFYLWGDVPALMPMTFRGSKVPGFRFDGESHGSFQTAAVEAIKNTGDSWFNIAHNTTSGVGNNPDGRKTAGHVNKRDGHSHTGHLTNPSDHLSGIKQGGDWFGKNCESSMSRLYGSKSPNRKAASAMIAKIPFALAQHIARTYYPVEALNG